MASTAAMRIRVATYNVLSHRLCSPSYFEHCDATVLCNDFRWNQVRERVINETKRNSVICLQEMSLSWTGKMHKEFEARNYHMVSCNYGKGFDGFMGVAVAYPRNLYRLADCQISRVADTKRGGYAEREPRVHSGSASPLVALKRFRKAMWGWLSSGIGLTATKTTKKERTVNPWRESQRRANQMVMVRLREVREGEHADQKGGTADSALVYSSESNNAVHVDETANAIANNNTNATTLEDHTGSLEFCVGTYHMPCAFWAPKVMTIHSALAAQHMEDFAKGLPFVLAGDFNFTPSSSQFKMITEGTLDEEDADHPGISHESDTWKPELGRPLQSAYTSVNGSEPAFTNYAKTKGSDQAFMETLDYLFFTSGAGDDSDANPSTLTCESVLATPNKDETLAEGASFPSASQPSDHVMVAAEWTLRGTRVARVNDALGDQEANDQKGDGQGQTTETPLDEPDNIHRPALL